MERINSSLEREIARNNEVVKGRSQKKARTRGFKLSSEKKEKLKRLLEDYGAEMWNLHAEQFEGLSGENCRLRSHNEHDPRINNGIFTEEEEERLRALHEIFGNKSSLFVRLFPGRNHQEVKTQWDVLKVRNMLEREIPSTKRKREVDDTGCPSREMVIGCSSTSGKSGVSSIFSQGQDEFIIMGVEDNTSMSTGTENRTSSNTMPKSTSASELHRNHEEREVTVPFMGVGSI